MIDRRLSLLVLLFTVPGPILAQEEDPPTDQALLAALESAAAAVAPHRVTHDEAQASFRALVGRFEEIHRALKALRLPESTAPAPGTPVWEEAQARVSFLEERERCLRERAVLLSAAVANLEARQGQVGRIRETTGQLEATLPALLDLARSVDERIADGRIAAEAVAPESGPRAIEAELALLAAGRIEWATLAATLPTWRRALEQSAAVEAAELARMPEGRARAADDLRRALQRKELHEQLAGLDSQSLVSRLAARLSPWIEESAAIGRRLEAVEAAARSQAAIEEELRALAPPNPDAFPIEPEIVPSVGRMRHDLALSRARREYLTRRLDALGRLATALDERIVFLEQLVTDLRRRDGASLELEVLAERLQAAAAAEPERGIVIPEGADPIRIAADQRRFRDLATEIAARLAERRQRLVAVSGSMVSDREILSDLDEALPRLEENLKREERWAEWADEAERLSPGQLLERHREVLASLAEQRIKVELLGENVSRIDEEIRRLDESIARLIDPLARQVGLVREEYIAARIAEFERFVAEAPPPGSGPWPGASRIQGSGGANGIYLTPTRPPDIAPPSDAEAVARAEEERTVQVIRLGAVAQRASIEDSLLEALARRIEALAAREAGRVELALRTRRLWGIAFVLQVRAAEGRIDAEDLPERIDEEAVRETVDRATAEIEPIRAALRRTEERRARLVEFRSLDEDLRTALGHHVDLVGRKIELIKRRRALAEALEAGRSGLDDLEAKRREHEVAERSNRDRTALERLLSIFLAEETAELDALLTACYRNLIEIEAERENLRRRGELTRRLVDLIETIRDDLAAQEPLIRRRIQRFEVELAMAEARAQASLLPAWSDEILAAFRSRTGISLEPPVPVAPADREAMFSRLADQLLERTVRVRANRLWLERVVQAQSRLGQLDTEIEFLRDQEAELAARDEEARLRGGRLTGFTDRELGTLPEEPGGQEESRRLRSGEIAILRGQRTETLWRATGWFAFHLLAVPVVALLAIRMGRIVGLWLTRRARAAAARLSIPAPVPLLSTPATDPHQEAIAATGDPAAPAPPPTPPAADPAPDEPTATPAAPGQPPVPDRAETLFTVFRTAWRTFVVAVALYWLLRVAHVDVTPLIASAGIVGLAVAFGAQSLLKDFFAGFFLLMEDQYKLGEIVTIGAVGGVVERVSLRLTVLRDVEGVVHFIPNGTIGMVSNRTRAWAQVKLEVAASYENDPDRVIATLERVGRELSIDRELGPKILAYQVMGVEQFAESGVVYRIHIKVTAGEQWFLARQTRRRILHAFEAAGIRIPLPQRVVRPFRAPTDDGPIVPDGDFED